MMPRIDHGTGPSNPIKVQRCPSALVAVQCRQTWPFYFSIPLSTLVMLGRLLNAARIRPPIDYELLPTSEWSARYSRKPSQGGVVRPWRRCSVTVLVVLVVGVATILTCVIYLSTHPLAWQSGILARLTGPKPLPPLYPEFREAELALPQHRNPDPFANGQKYLWIASHTQCTCSPCISRVLCTK